MKRLPIRLPGPLLAIFRYRLDRWPFVERKATLRDSHVARFGLRQDDHGEYHIGRDLRSTGSFSSEREQTARNIWIILHAHSEHYLGPHYRQFKTFSNKNFSQATFPFQNVLQKNRT